MILGAVLTLALYTEVSQPGETMDEFAIRIAPRAMAETTQRDAEVCVSIETHPDGLMRIAVQTDGKPLSCTVPAGGQTFHTHTRLGGPRWSSADYKAPGYLAWDQRVFHQQGPRQTRMVGRFNRLPSQRTFCSSQTDCLAELP